MKCQSHGKKCQSHGKKCQSCTNYFAWLWDRVAELWVQIAITMAGCQNWVCRFNLHVGHDSPFQPTNADHGAISEMVGGSYDYSVNMPLQDGTAQNKEGKKIMNCLI